MRPYSSRMKTLLVLFVAALALIAPAADNFSTLRLLQQSAADSAVTKLDSLEAVQAEFFKRFIESPGFGPARIIRPPFHQPVQLVRGDTLYQVPPPELIGLE